MDPNRLLSLHEHAGLTRQALAEMILDCEALLGRADLTPGERMKIGIVQATVRIVSGHMLTILEPLEGEIEAAGDLECVDSTELE